MSTVQPTEETSKASATVKLTEEIPKDTEATKPCKSKTARPSAEPYVPPSRRSLNTSQVSTSAINVTSSPEKVVSKEVETKSNQRTTNDNDDEDNWEQLLDKSDESIAKELIKEVI